MKKLLIAIVTIIAINNVAYADMTPPTSGPQGPAPSSAMMSGGMDMGKGTHPCKKIAEVCKAAGFVRGGSSTGKGIMENCIQPIMSGQQVTGVKVDPSDIAACKQRHSQNMPH
jgi:hypothetical protein